MFLSISHTVCHYVVQNALNHTDAAYKNTLHEMAPNQFLIHLLFIFYSMYLQLLFGVSLPFWREGAKTVLKNQKNINIYVD